MGILYRAIQILDWTPLSLADRFCSQLYRSVGFWRISSKVLLYLKVRLAMKRGARHSLPETLVCCRETKGWLFKSHVHDTRRRNTCTCIPYR
jgi:hypothetical protein